MVFPGNLLNNLVQSLPIFFLGRMDSQVLGYYGLARRIIEFPLQFVSSAVQRLYAKELLDEIEKTGAGFNAYKKNLKIFGFLAVVLIIGLLTMTRSLLPILFGLEWMPAVPYVMILGILISVRFVFGGLSFILVLGKAPKIALLWQIFFAIVMIITFLVCHFTKCSSIITILYYVIVGVFSYIFYGLLSYKVSKSNLNLSSKI